MQYSLEIQHGFIEKESAGGGLPRGELLWETLRASASDLWLYKEYIQNLYQEDNRENGRHDVGHIARVLVLASVLCAKAEAAGAVIDRDVVYMSVLLHDAERHGFDEPGTPDHAEQAAERFAAGVRFFFPQKADHMLSIIRWHNKFPEYVPKELQECVLTHEFFIVTGADALDLVRLGDELITRIFTREAWDLREPAQELERRCGERQSGDIFEDVLATAVAMGMLYE